MQFQRAVFKVTRRDAACCEGRKIAGTCNIDFRDEYRPAVIFSRRANVPLASQLVFKLGVSTRATWTLLKISRPLFSLLPRVLLCPNKFSKDAPCKMHRGRMLKFQNRFDATGQKPKLPKSFSVGCRS